MHRRLYLIAIIAALVLAFVSPQSPVAAEEPDYDWCVLYDLRTEPGPIAASYDFNRLALVTSHGDGSNPPWARLGIWSGGTGWINEGVAGVNDVWFGGTRGSMLRIGFTIPGGGAQIVRMAYRRSAGNGTLWTGGYRAIQYQDGGGYNNLKNIVAETSFGGNINNIRTVHEMDVFVTSIGFTWKWNRGSDAQYWVHMYELELYGTGPNPFDRNDCGEIIPEYTRPVAVEYRETLVATTDSSVLATTSAAAGDRPVHAATAGTVLSVEPSEFEECYDAGILSSCSSARTVVIDDGVNEFTYVLRNPTVTPTDEVVAGCRLGETIDRRALVVRDEAPLLEYMLIEPDPDAAACGEPPEPPPRVCLPGTSIFDAGSGWNISGPHTVSSSAVTLYPTASIRQTASLPDDRRVSMVVMASADDNSGMTIRIGHSTSAYNVSQMQQTHTKGPAYYMPDLLSYFTLAISNTGPEPIAVGDVCLEIEEPETGGGPLEQCIFTNYMFFNLDEFWNSSAGVLFEDAQALMSSGQSIMQDVNLYPPTDGDATYTVQADFAIWYHDDAYHDAANGDLVTMHYIYPDSGAAVELDQLEMLNDNYYRASTEIEVSEPMAGGFIFSPEVASAPGVRGIALRRVCLESDAFYDEDGNPFEPGGPSFDVKCGPNPRPSGGFIGDWVTWHLRNLERFFNCDLMAVLNALFELSRWSQALALHSFQWLTDVLVPYAGGYLDNISAALVLIASGAAFDAYHSSGETIYWPSSLGEPEPDGDIMMLDGGFVMMSGEPEQECAWYAFWCHGSRAASKVWNWTSDTVAGVWNAMLAALEWIVKALTFIVDQVTYAIRFLWDTLRGIVTFLWWLLGELLEILRLVRDTVMMFVEEWNNADPAPIPGMANCDVNPEQNKLCITWWMLQETIFSGSYGQAIMPLITAIFALVAVLTLAFKLRDILITTNRNAL